MRRTGVRDEGVGNGGERPSPMRPEMVETLLEVAARGGAGPEAITAQLGVAVGEHTAGDEPDRD